MISIHSNFLPILPIALVLGAAAPLPSETSRPSLSDSLEVARKAIEAERIDPLEMQYDVSSDGRYLVYPAFSRSIDDNRVATDLWLQDLSSKGRSVMLIKGKGAADTWPIRVVPKISPDGKMVAFISNGVNPGITNQKVDVPRAIAIIDLVSRQTRHIKPVFANKTGNDANQSMADFEWAPDGRRLAVIFNEDPDHSPIRMGVSVTTEWIAGEELGETPYQRLAVLDAHTGQVLAVTPERRQVNLAKWSPDGRMLAISGRLARAIGDGDSGPISGNSLFLFDPESAEETRITEPGFLSELSWSPDGRHIAFAIAENAYKGSLINIFNMDTRELHEVPFGDRASRPYDLVWISNKKLVGYAPTKMGCQLQIFDVKEGFERQLSPDDMSCNIKPKWIAKDRKLVFVRSAFTQPAEIYTSGISRWDPQPLTKLSAGLKLPPMDFVTISWPSNDGRYTIHGILATPKDNHRGRRPLIVSIPGGPSMLRADLQGGVHAQHLLHAMIARGYAVLMPNTRGRAGYGKDFRDAITQHQDYLEGPFTDVMGGVELLERQGVADPDRMAVIGFSYGGILSAYTMTRTHRFKAAVLGDPGNMDLVNWGYRSAANYNSVIAEGIMGVGPVHAPGQKEARERNSVAAHIHRARTPTLLECGLGGAERGCPEVFQSLRYFRVPSEMVVYPRTGHGITEPALKYDSERRRLEWLDYWVLGTPIPSLVNRYGPPKLPEWKH